VLTPMISGFAVTDPIELPIGGVGVTGSTFESSLQPFNIKDKVIVKQKIKNLIVFILSLNLVFNWTKLLN